MAGAGADLPVCFRPRGGSAVDIDILAPRSLIQLANHFKGTQVMARPEPAVARQSGRLPDLRDIKAGECSPRARNAPQAGTTCYH